MGELNSGPNAVSGKGLAAAAVNQTNLVIVARHGRQLPAHSLQGEEESAIHDRDSSIGSGPAPLKAEVFTLQKSGSFHFALTGGFPRRLTSPIDLARIPLGSLRMPFPAQGEVVSDCLAALAGKNR